MKKLFSTTCIPAGADSSNGTFLRRFVRDEDGNITMLSIALIATGAVLSGIAWDLNTYEYRRVGIQQIADRAVLAAADLDQTIAGDIVVQDYFDKAGYGDVVSKVTVSEGLNFRTVSVDVKGLVASQTIAGNYSGEVIISGNAAVDAPIRARQRMNENRLLDQGMSYDQILEDVISQEFTRGGVTRAESDRIAELRILLRDSINTGGMSLSEGQIMSQEYTRYKAAGNGANSQSYSSAQARAIANTLTQADARALVDLRLAMQEDMANRAGNFANYIENYDFTPDQRQLLDMRNAEDLAAAFRADTPEDRTRLATDLAQLNDAIFDDQWEVSRREDGNYIEMTAFAEAEERVNNVEISVVLDISGSMGWDGKMKNLRDAANTFVDAVINPSTEDLVSVSIIPYAEHVSAGQDIMDELNVRQVHTYSHCIEFDDADFDTTAISPRANNASNRYQQMQHFYWGSSNSNNRNDPACRNGTYDDIEAFSQNTAELKDKIARLTPDGNTSIFLGMKWAAGLLDPSFQPVNARLASRGKTDQVFANRPVAFDDRETLKTVILMTDGENTSSKRINPQVYANSSHYAHWNAYNFDWYVRNYVNWNEREYWSQSKYWTSFGDQLLDNVCTAAKDNNIVIWSIGFEVSTRSANVMRKCASSPSHYFGVEGVEIKEAFSAIARQINQLRLTQ